MKFEPILMTEFKMPNLVKIDLSYFNKLLKKYTYLSQNLPSYMLIHAGYFLLGYGL